MILAGIDIGTNTLRLLIAEVDGSGMRDLQLVRRITRLGEGIGRTGKLRPDAIRRTIKALHTFKERIGQYPVDGLTVVGTSAVRSAKNQEDFLCQVRNRVGFDVEVLSGEEEARRTHSGVALGLSVHSRNSLIIDIGGGSTEFIYIYRSNVEEVYSLPLGVVSLTEQFLTSDPSTSEEVGSLRKVLAGTFRDFPGFSDLKPDELVATAGTATTLAAMAQGLESYDRQKVHGFYLPKTEILGILERMVGMTLEERRKLPGLESGREDVLVAGILILLCSMEFFRVNGVRVSDFGLLEGILVHHWKKIKGIIPFPG